jgi:tRNA nucleotidyltransferase/poly(A) polymerase
MSEPRYAADYTARQIAAARRVLVDVQQVLAGFRDGIVLVGGWVPDLLLPDAAEPHVGSIDVDLALDAKRLEDGRYAELLKLLLDTGRYHPGPRQFQVTTSVDLHDRQNPVGVEVDFLAARHVRLRGKGRAKGFRVLQADG